MKGSIKKVLVRTGIFWGLLLLVYTAFYIENRWVDNSMTLPQNPDLLFADTYFQDSILQNTVKGEYFVLAQKYAEFMLVNGRDRYGKEHSPLFATTLNRETGNAYSSK